MMKDLYDIVVIGGGLCGFACAVRSAWNGKSVLLVERRPALGWESTWACQLSFSGTCSPVADRIKNELRNVGGLKHDRADAPILEIALDRLAREAGVSVLLYSYPVRIIFEDNMAVGVVIGSKSGEQILTAKVIVDAEESALLWRQTKVDISLPDKTSARQTIFFNHAGGEIDLPMDLGNGIVLYPSVWNGEVCVEFDVGSADPLTARRMIPEVVRRIRERVPQLKDALVTHTGNEPFPIEPVVHLENRSIEHPELKNFFGAGIWTEDVPNTPIGRLNLGEEVGEIASKCETTKVPSKGIIAGSFFEQPEEITSDVIVVGGGTGGSIAGISAGRQGVKTMLVEASPILGGIGTGGAIHSYYYGIDGGLQDEVDDRIKSLTPLFSGKWRVTGFHPEVKKIVLQEMLEEANVNILLNTVVTGVLCKDEACPVRRGSQSKTLMALQGEGEKMNELIGIIAAGADGVSVYKSKVFIDSTGDGDVAVMSGVPFLIGRERDNLMHAFSQPCGILNKEGALSFMNFDAGYVDPTDVEDLTRGRRHGINIFWRDKFSEETRPLYIAPIIGIRQSRQIIGEYQLTLEDEVAGRRFEDVVSFTMAHYDNHGWDYENDSDPAVIWVWVLGNWGKPIGCEVPYRCLIPRNVDGLLLACRAISLTYDAHMEFRMQRDIQRIGEVAGIAAALSVKKGVSPRQIDVKELQAILKERGILDEKYRPKPAIPARKPQELPAVSPLRPEKVEELVWVSTYSSPASVPALRSMLSSSDIELRFKASAGLALHGISEGVQELIRCVETRTEEKLKGNKTVPMWQSAIPLLGMAKDKRAVPVLLDVLKDEKASLDALIGAVRALERIGDSSAIPALRELLKRENLPTERTLQISTGATHLPPVVEDARWQIELAVASALSVLGAPKEETRQIIEPYLKDERAYVRRYAEKLLTKVML